MVRKWLCNHAAATHAGLHLDPRCSATIGAPAGSHGAATGETEEDLSSEAPSQVDSVDAGADKVSCPLSRWLSVKRLLPAKRRFTSALTNEQEKVIADVVAAYIVKELGIVDCTAEGNGLERRYGGPRPPPFCPLLLPLQTLLWR